MPGFHRFRHVAVFFHIFTAAALQRCRHYAAPSAAVTLSFRHTPYAFADYYFRRLRFELQLFAAMLLFVAIQAHITLLCFWLSCCRFRCFAAFLRAPALMTYADYAFAAAILPRCYADICYDAAIFTRHYAAADFRWIR